MLERVNWDDEFVTDQPWSRVRALREAVRRKDPSTLFGVGADVGRLVIFGSPATFDPEGQPSTYLLASLAALPLAGSSAFRSVVPPKARLGYQSWPLRDVAPWTLLATQDSVRSDALTHYLGEDYWRIGSLFDRKASSANDDPVVVSTEGRRYVLMGHHRTVAALLRGTALTVRYRDLDAEAGGA